ncbi:Uncharacterised protein [uncultured archaeon]|nr:Uncharacterised protein [uncultured archaeon]
MIDFSKISSHDIVRYQCSLSGGKYVVYFGTVKDGMFCNLENQNNALGIDRNNALGLGQNWMIGPEKNKDVRKFYFLSSKEEYLLFKLMYGKSWSVVVHQLF